jgi:hypothetical protein
MIESDMLIRTGSKDDVAAIQRLTREAYQKAALVFSCSLLHEVLPVELGERYAFLLFFYDKAASHGQCISTTSPGAAAEPWATGRENMRASLLELRYALKSNVDVART